MEDNRNPEDHTQALLSALSEKIGESKIQASGEGGLDGSNGNGEDLTASGEMEVWEGGDCWEGGGWGQGGNYGGYGEDQHLGMGSQMGGQNGRRRGERREATRRQERSGGGAFGNDSQSQTCSSTVQEAWQAATDRQAAITTVMFRNIPNK